MSNSTLRLGIRAHDVSADNFAKLPEAIKDSGFCCTQLALRKAIKEFNVSPEAMSPGMAYYIKNLFNKSNVEIAVLGCYFNLATPDTRQLQDNIHLYENHIRFASLLGCSMVGTETGAVNTAYKYEPANHSAEALNIFIESLKRVLYFAERMGVLVGIEPVYKHIMWDLEATKYVIDKVASPNLRIIFDPVNLLSVNNYEHQTEIINEAFDLLSDKIDVIHLKDFVIKEDEIVSRPVTFGEGLFDFKTLFSCAKKNKPYISMLIEDSLPSNINITKNYIENLYSSIDI